MVTKQNKIALIFLTLLLWISLPTSQLHSQNDPVRFESLSLQNGVSLNLTYCMLQDSRGYIWFGTMYGLVRYDGKNYLTYRSNTLDSTSITFDDITSLFEDSKGYIWVGTWGGGLNKFNPETKKFTRFLYNPDNSNGICDNIVWSINEDNEGNIWVGTDKGGVDKYDPGTKEFKHYYDYENAENSIPSNTVKKIYKDKQGNIWLGTKKGLAKYLPSTDNFKSYLITPFITKDENINVVQTIYEDSDNNFWIGTWNGLFKFDRIKENFYEINYEPKNENFQNIVFSLLEDQNQSMWIGTSYGLYKLNLRRQPSTVVYRHEYGNSNSLMGNNVNQLMEDNSGTMWINCNRSGINKLVTRKRNFNYYTYDPNNNNTLGGYYIYSLNEDDNGNIWIGTANNILNKFNKKENKITRYFLSDSKKGNRFSIPNLAVSGDKLWLGTTRGVMLFDNKTSKIINLPMVLHSYQDIVNGNVTSLLITKDNKLLIGIYEHGLYSYDLSTGEVRHYIYSTSQLVNYMRNTKITLYQDRERNIWAGTFGGLEKIDLTTGKIENFFHKLSDPNSLSNDYVYSIYEDKNANLWVATSNGLNLFNKKDKTFKNYFVKDGLPSNVIMGLEGDNEGNIWISTYKGLSRFDVDNMTFKNFDIDDGLQSNIFFPDCALMAKTGLLYFGGNNGLNSFDPQKIKINNFIPPVYITQIKAGKDIGNLTKINELDNSPEFPYDNNFFDISFAALDYSNPDKNAYKYKLDGVDKDWVYGGNNTDVSYTDLSPGDYTFRVMGSNSDGIWNENAAVFSFVITPPFWKTWWFITLALLLFLVTIYTTHLVWVRNKIKLALEIEKAREEESEKVRKQTSVDFHDELGHRLTRISLLTEIAKRKIGHDDSIIPLLKKISENSIQLYEGTKDFIWAIDPQNDSLYELLVRLKDFGDEIFNDSNIDFLVKGISSELEKTELSTDMKRHLTLIFKEAMHNSLKHSHSKKVMLESKIVGDEVEIVLEDDGNGFDGSISSNGHGLKNMAKRAEKINGSLKITSSPGNGTKLLFRGKIKEKVA
ncbi:MAG TPA: two-component regulator propeller domain-containing protein [Ignavibacteriaceae bacterium]|nr:two-component regulator propeller domain-containing protein [Ignavibacteriaceae bacterium]